MWFTATVCFSLYMISCLNIVFDTLNVTVVFDTRNVRSSSFRHYESLIITKWGCQRLCMSLWYIKSSNHSHSPSTFLSGLHCPIKKIWGLETAGVKGGKEIQYEWEKEHIGTSYVCNLCPAVSCLSNRMTSMRKWNYGLMLNTVLMLGTQCVCVFGRDDDLLEPAGYELSSKQTHSCRASVMRPIYSSPLSAGRHAVPHFRFYCIASVSPSRGARRGAVATAEIWPGKVKFILWWAIAKAWDMKSGSVLRLFHVWVATVWSEKEKKFPL